MPSAALAKPNCESSGLLASLLEVQRAERRALILPLQRVLLVDSPILMVWRPASFVRLTA